MIAIQSHAITSKVIQDIKQHQTIDYENFSNWIPAGSGNFEKTKTDGWYRENCNTYRDTITCEHHRIESLKLIFNHCNKLDCETCFIHASSDRARILNERLLEFQKEAKKYGIKTGNILHIIFNPKNNLALKRMKDYNEFLEFRSNEIFTMLKDCGIFAGIIFTQLWSYKCQICGKEERKCICQEKELERELNPHFHVVGFGYLKNNREFREQYEDWVYINLGRRKDGYHTIFYILTNAALWRNEDGKLKPAYQSFGYLKSSEFVQIKEKIKFINDRCPICKKPRKKVVKGVEVHTDPVEIRNSISLSNRAQNQIILGEKLLHKKVEGLFNHNQNKIYLLNVSENYIVLGSEMKYKRIIREYKFLNIEWLRQITMKNRIQYKKDRKKWEKDNKQGNGYG